MASSNKMQNKQELQAILKENYGINKNISDPLSVPECHRLLQLMRDETSVSTLTESLIAKNKELATNNRTLGQRRGGAERKRDRALTEIKALQDENTTLKQFIAELSQENTGLREDNRQLVEQSQSLEHEIAELRQKNQHLQTTVSDLSTKNSELAAANDELKRDNKELKNIVDQIKLRLAQDTRTLLQYEDSEIRKALIQLFRWTLG